MARRALVASHAPPLFDRDSGSRRVMDLIELLVEDGWHVTFVSTNGIRHPRYATELQRRGVHVVNGQEDGVEDLLVVGGFDLALLVSWPVAELYLPLVRTLSPQTRVVVDTVDLQFLRDARRVFQAVGHARLLDDEFGRQFVAELNTYAAADAVLTVSLKEAAVVADITGRNTLAHVVPDIEDEPKRSVRLAARSGMLFVGSFRHTPNVHAVEYLCREIVPRLDPQLLALHPLYVVGDALDASVRRYAEGQPGVRMVGWVPEILPYLQRVRISVVPLQFGAGTKRKMIQTLMAGTPCVSSSVGVEGLDLRPDRQVLVADDPESFASAVTRLLQDDQLWHRLSRESRKPIATVHARSAVAERFRRVLEVVAAAPTAGVVLPASERAVYDARLIYQDNQRTGAHLRELLQGLVPRDAVVLVASGGSEELLRLGEFTVWHFPRGDDGKIAPNPGNAPALIATVGHLKNQGATHLLFPKRARWWFDFYPEFEAFLRNHHSALTENEDWGVLFELSGVERRGVPRIRSAPRAVVTPPVTDAQPSPAAASDEVAKLIAFLLPQFHRIPENDRWWGRGFTEWTNVARARPLFPGHVQPQVPGELGFYDLRLPETRRAQAELAREHGIHAFCYYHYWFSGVRLLDRPFNAVLESGRPDFPFCLCWANEPWSRRWDGRNEDVLQPQTYSAADDVAHLQALLPAFRDERYVRVAGRPVFLVYQPRDMPDPAATVERWRTEADRAGLPGLYLLAVETGWDAGWDATTVGFDAKVLFQPQFTMLSRTPRRPVEPASLQVYDYATAWPVLARPPDVPYPRYDTVFPTWDNSARRGTEGVVIDGSTPAEYQAWLGLACDRAARRVADGVAPEPFVFVNAWNEWAEGCHLEPDVRHGRAYLEATRRALTGARSRAGALPVGPSSVDARSIGTRP
jgi:glycosyltransferase involved in cell wall biosynthesis